MPTDQIAETERTLIGSMLWGPRAIEMALDVVDARDFVSAETRRVFVTLVRAYESGQPLDVAHVAHDAQLERATLLSWQALSTTSGQATSLARVVKEHAERRRMVAIAGEIAHRLDDPTNTVDEVLTFASSELNDVAARHGNEDITVFGMDDCANVEEQEPDWVVPNLLERHDRMMITGAEGLGKSTLLRQIGMMIAIGMHPFTRAAIPKRRVLMVDCENTSAQFMRAGAQLREVAGSRYTEDLFRWCCIPQGTDLRSTIERHRLEKVLRRVQPDLVIIGPLYKLVVARSGEQISDEKVAAETAHVLDELRMRYSCALLIEAHAPHGDSGNRANYRPFGASLWMRWPEFGVGLKAVDDTMQEAEVVSWRGARDRNRKFPHRLVTSNGYWPWVDPEVRDWT